MANFDDYKVYRSYEDFEREELRRLDAVGTSVDDLLDDMFAGELDFDESSVKKSHRDDEDDEE